MSQTTKTIFTIRHSCTPTPPVVRVPTHVEVNGDLDLRFGNYAPATISAATISG